MCEISCKGWNDHKYNIYLLIFPQENKLSILWKLDTIFWKQTLTAYKYSEQEWKCGANL